MSTVGPELPPHLLTKRKREDDEETYPTPPKRPRSSSANSNEDAPKRIIGPAPPPAPLSELPPTNPSPNAEEREDDASSSDDDFGPSLPPAPGSTPHKTELQRQQNLEREIAARESSKKPQREEWMLVPPSQSDWTTRIDPTKLRNRKFNTGKSAKTPQSTKGSSLENPLWTETPEQKRQRLEDEVLGIRKPAQLGETEEGDERDMKRREEARETERRIREFNEREGRGGSLLGEHGKKGPKDGKKEEDDDPSKRAFDREKDMGLGAKIGHKQKREMVDRAKDFGSRFAGGRYL